MGKAKKEDVEKFVKTTTPKQYKQEKRFTARERMAHHREGANTAFKDGDIVKATGHLKGYNKAKDQLDSWMQKTPDERQAIIDEKQKKT